MKFLANIAKRNLDNIKIPIIFVTVIWFIFLLDSVLPIELNQYGIYARKMSTLLSGIVLFSLLHGNLSHIISNTIPLFTLMILLLTFYKKHWWQTVITICLGSGVLIWIFGRSAYHIGASALIFGLIGFLTTAGFLTKRFVGLVVSVVVIVFYGGSTVSGLLPLQHWISWEGHLFGLLVGIAFAILLFGNKKSKNYHQQKYLR